ncbi:hypothetical protein BD560DRAFT_376592 [Blakeslea trispora]|nr:hypothetical protein BD560DRAFT_376592 [Blakeslea trispora]
MLFDRYRNKSKSTSLTSSTSEKKKLSLFRRIPIYLSTNRRKQKKPANELNQPRTSISLPNIHRLEDALLEAEEAKIGTPSPIPTLTKQRKRHSADQRRHRQLVQDNRHSITFGHLPPLKAKAMADMAFSPEQLAKLDRLAHLPDNTEQLLARLVGINKQLVPHRSISHQNLNAPTHTKSIPPVPIDPKSLAQLLMSQQALVLIDVRNLIDYQRTRIRHSINVNLPSLLIKRYQRGTIANFNLENFITTSEGRAIYAAKQQPAIPLMGTILEQKALEAEWKQRKRTVWVVAKRRTEQSQDTTPHTNPILIPNQTIPNLIRVTEDEEVMTSPRTEQEFSFVISEIIPGFLFVGPEIETEEQARQLDERQIKRVLNMAEECQDDGLASRPIVYHKIAARDTLEMKNIELVMMEAVCFIEEAKKHHEPIYVHCKAGKSRSITAILAYLVTSERWTLKRAYRHVIKARPNMSPNIGFISELLKMEGKVHGRVSSFMETDWQSSSLPSPEYAHELCQLEKAWQTMA